MIWTILTVVANQFVVVRMRLGSFKFCKLKLLCKLNYKCLQQLGCLIRCLRFGKSCSACELAPGSITDFQEGH